MNFFRDGKLLFFDEDGRSNLGGTVVKSGLTLLLSEVYNFKGIDYTVYFKTIAFSIMSDVVFDDARRLVRRSK